MAKFFKKYWPLLCLFLSIAALALFLVLFYNSSPTPKRSMQVLIITIAYIQVICFIVILARAKGRKWYKIVLSLMLLAVSVTILVISIPYKQQSMQLSEKYQELRQQIEETEDQDEIDILYDQTFETLMQRSEVLFKDRLYNFLINVSIIVCSIIMPSKRNYKDTARHKEDSGVIAIDEAEK